MTPSAAVLCTRNAHKVTELQALLPELDLQPLPDEIEMPEETGTTFEQNARLKALAGAEALPGRWVVADDSGLCVDALDGAPGVRSARFAGEDATDAENNLRLLEQLAHLPELERRSARFVCVLVAIAPDGTEHVAEGRVEGHVAPRPDGVDGFGYDPLFIPSGFEATFGVLGADVKHRLSHRARAASALAARLREAVHAG